MHKIPFYCVGTVATGYEEFNKSKDMGMYSKIGGILKDTGVGVYSIASNAGIYLSGIAILVSLVLLIYNAHNPQGLSETKRNVIAVFAIVILLFGVGNLVQMIVNASL